MTWQVITANESHCVDRPFEVVPRAAELLRANDWFERRKIWTLGDMAGLRDGTVFRTAPGYVFEIRDGHIVRTDSQTWWSPLADWLPLTILDEPAP